MDCDNGHTATTKCRKSEVISRGRWGNQQGADRRSIGERVGSLMLQQGQGCDRQRNRPEFGSEAGGRNWSQLVDEGLGAWWKSSNNLTVG